MSTDIVQYQLTDAGKSEEIFQLGALQLYMAITVPLMVITFGAWYGVYWFVDRKEAARDQKKKLEAMV
jgi:TRAP-type C4-dicarboxylate transport system permease large subunit